MTPKLGTVTFRNGITRKFSLCSSKSRTDYLLALLSTKRVDDTVDETTEVANLLWMWIKQGLIERRDFQRVIRAMRIDR